MCYLKSFSHRPQRTYICITNYQSGYRAHFTFQVIGFGRLHLRSFLSWRGSNLHSVCRSYKNNTDNMAVSKIDSPFFHSIFTKEVNELSRLFKKHSFELRIAGGAVRDLLMNKPPNDIDFATTATPAQMKEMFTAENVRMIHHKVSSVN